MPLDQANEALRKLHAGSVTGRIVLESTDATSGSDPQGK
jgi:D-arabinose 1-dehydrogenase-like Zn-dependent alcohol dehydrogenase